MANNLTEIVTFVAFIWKWRKMRVTLYAIIDKLGQQFRNKDQAIFIGL